MKVGFQGINGAYSETAIYNFFDKKTKTNGYDTFEDVFESVKTNKADYGVIPVENTITGSIAINYDLLLKEDVRVIAEICIPVHHNLISHHGNKIKNIKRVYSHPQALEQCKYFLKKNKFKPCPEYDTAGAVKSIKQRRDMEEAAIASELCAETYNMDILSKNIESNKNNITRFFVITNRNNIGKKFVSGLKKEKTSIAFKTKHIPGALVNCLQRLYKNGINLTKLESRPIIGTPWEYVFFADFEGGIDDENVKFTLKEMEAASIFVKVLGSYPKGN